MQALEKDISFVHISFRYLSTGMLFRALAFSFRMGIATVRKIIKETVRIILEELQPLHMQVPTTASLKNNAAEFEKVWNFPHVVGCLVWKTYPYYFF